MKQSLRFQSEELKLRRKKRACHESAHAVIAIFLNIPLVETTIRNDIVQQGRTTYKKTDEENTNDYKRKRILVAYAGPYGYDIKSPDGWISDAEQATRFCKEIFGKEDMEYLRAREQESVELVSQHMNCIQAVAQVMLEKKDTLSEAEVKAIIKAKT